MVRILLFLVLVGAGILGMSVPAAAQPPRTAKQPVGPRKQEPDRPAMMPGWPLTGRPGEDEVEDYRQWLAGMLAKPQSKGVDEKVLKDLMDKLNKMPKDQQPDKADIEKLLKDNPAFKDPEFLKQLEKMVQDPNFPKNLEGKLPKDVPVPDKENGADLKDKLKDVIESGKNGGGPEVPKKGDPPNVDPDHPDPSKLTDSGQKNPYADNEWVKWMQKNFGDSPAAQDAVKDLVSSLKTGDMKGMFDEVPEFKNGAWKDFEGWGKSNSDGWNFKPPDISTGQGGSSFGGGGGGSSFGGAGGGASVGGAGGVGLGGGGTALAVIAGIAAALFLALMLFRRWKIDQARRAAQGAGGPTGIDFDSIRTREELVRAFDHVSLDQIGEEARAWNHRVIADQLAEVKPAQAEPATELAGIYERARYAPLDEDLSAGDFVDARRDLRVISGGPA